MLFDFINDAYRFSVPITLVIYFFVKKENKKWLLNVIATSNFLLVVYCFYCYASLLYLIESLFQNFSDQSKYEGYTFWYSKADLFSPYGWLFYANSLALILPFLFLFKKLRVNLWLVVIETILLWLEEIGLLITKLFRDYLPSSWSVYYTEASNPFRVLNYICMFIAAYALLWLLKKLPSQHKKIK